MTTAGDKLKEALDAIGSTRTAAADQIGISRQYLYALQCGEKDPTSTVIGNILAFLNRPEHLRKLGRRRPVTFEDLFAPAKQGRAA
jgi:DNA-binding XRE family transcriptional regulator